MNHPTSPLTIILAAAAALAHIGCGDATPRHAEHLSSTADDLAVAPIKDYIVNNCPSQPTGIGGVSVVIDVCDPQWTCACPTDDDDSDDDAPALQCWIDLAADEAEQAGGHAVLRLPADALYHVAAQGDDPTWKTALLLRSRMTIRTKGRRAPATIKLRTTRTDSRPSLAASTTPMTNTPSSCTTAGSSTSPSTVTVRATPSARRRSTPRPTSWEATPPSTCIPAPPTVRCPRMSASSG